MAKNQEKKQQELDYAELHGIPRMSISEAAEHLEVSIKTCAHRGVPCYIGPSGLGKSQVVNQVARRLGMSVCYINTANFNAVGAGVPSIKDAGDGFFKLRLPNIFPKDGEKAILFFDEINQGSQHAINMFFSLIEDRRMFDYHLPDDCAIVAAMNPSGANYNVQQIENNAALNRRLKRIVIIPSYADWLKHAQTPEFHYTDRACPAIGEAGFPCHPDILSVLKAAPKMLDDPEALKNNKQFPCPATWQTVSLDAYVLQYLQRSLYDDFALGRYAASIGIPAAEQVCAYIKDHNTLINAHDVLMRYSFVKGKVDKLIKDSRAEILTDLCHNVLKALFASKPDPEKVVKNFVQFLGDLPNEQGTMMLQQQRAVANESGAKDYLKELMQHMQNVEGFIEWHQRVDAAYRAVDNSLRGK